MQRKGQAAMEFLMTYGWAILAAIIAIGVLAYFGVFSPGKYLPEICTINAPLGCEEHAIIAGSPTGSVRLIIRNGAGDSITINSIGVSGCATDSTGWTVADGDVEDVTITCTGALTSGQKFSGDVTITYLKSGATINQTATGRVSGKAA